MRSDGRRPVTLTLTFHFHNAADVPRPETTDARKLLIRAILDFVSANVAGESARQHPSAASACALQFQSGILNKRCGSGKTLHGMIDQRFQGRPCFGKAQ